MEQNLRRPRNAELMHLFCIFQGRGGSGGRDLTEGVGEMFRNLVPALDNPSLSPNQGITSVNFSQDEAVKAAGNTVSFVFRTKMFGQDTAQERL